MIGYSHRLSPRRAGWAALAIALVALPAAANAQGLFSIFRGGEPSPYDIERQLQDSGYVVTGPLLLRGNVYLADVIVRGEGPERLIINPESGRIMQRFRMRGEGWREAAAPPPPDAWNDDPRAWNGPRPPADVGPGGPPPPQPQNGWLQQGSAPPAPAAIETPKSAPKRVEIKPKPTPVANVANPPAVRLTPAPGSSTPAKPAPVLAQPTPAASISPTPTPAASAKPTASPTPQQAAKVDSPPAAPAPAPSAIAPASAPSAKGKSVNDIPVTPLD